MLYLAILLHIYQPPTQFPHITKQICDQSYRLILKILNKTKGKITLNIPASLSEQLVSLKQEDIIRGIIDLVRKKQVELTATGAYHPLLSRLPRQEIKRQIELNSSINKKIFGDKIYCPNGLFPPELAYSNQIDGVLRELGLKWFLLDELAFPKKEKTFRRDVIYIKEDKNYNHYNSYNDYKNRDESLEFFFRDDRLSLALALSGVKNFAGFYRLTKRYSLTTNHYLIVALDGETFGHHQPGQDKLLSDILISRKYNLVTVSELGKYFRKKVTIEPLTSSWGVGKEDLRKKIYWPRWSYPGNRIHQLQWRLTKIALDSVKNGEDRRSKVEGETLDKALHSDQYWWASRNPYWHPEMIRRGAGLLLKSITENPIVNNRIKKEAEKAYNDILEEVGKYGDKIIT